MRSGCFITRLTARLFIILFFLPCLLRAQDNDACSQAHAVIISGQGFGIGIHNSDTVSLTSATVQTGEGFAPALFVAGLTQKSIWYKFSLPTTRSVRVTLTQPGNIITAGDVGFTVYKASNCLPATSQISPKLTPIGVFGNTFHPCVEQGDYLVQVSAKASANGPIYIQVETAMPSAAYDKPADAYNYGTLTVGTQTLSYNVNCQSIDDASEVCTSLANYTEYSKTSWHVFNTGSYFDYLFFFLGHLNNGAKKFGYKLYQGDVRTTPYASLPLVDGCDSLMTTQFYGKSWSYKCQDLNPNTTYSIQLFFHKDFNDDIRLVISKAGQAATRAPQPATASIPPVTNALGVLPSSGTGINTPASDYFGCNSRHSENTCSPSMPAAGFQYAPGYHFYKLSSFFTFTLSSTSNFSISGSSQFCGRPLVYRLYRQDVTANCTGLDTANIIATIASSGSLPCLPPGQYTLQVMGSDSMTNTTSYTYGSFPGSTSSTVCAYENLGTRFNININIKRVQAINKFSLNGPGAVDTINRVNGVMQPMVHGVLYLAKSDTFSCSKTLLPSDTSCSPINNRAVFREMAIGDSGLLVNHSYWTWNKIYRGDAQALAASQGVSAFPSKITGLIPQTLCYNYNNHGCLGNRTCVVPGTYTQVSFGNDGNISQAVDGQLRYYQVTTTYHSPAVAENMGDINSQVPSSGGQVNSAIDYFSFKDNAVIINGQAPCSIGGYTATKAIYRQFYLSATSLVTIENYYDNNCDFVRPTNRLFYGKATDGINGLTLVGGPFNCFLNASTSTCAPLEPGWYTIVSYGVGTSYSNPVPANTGIEYYSNSFLGMKSRIIVRVIPACPGPKYNRPYKAAIDTLTQQPFLIQWRPRLTHTAAYPRTDTTYTLYRENFNCTVDTPFILPSCNSSMVKTAFYVFTTTQESFVQIDNKGLWAVVYKGNARTADSTNFATATPIQTCLQGYGQIQICKLEPGTYTLILFAPSTSTCSNVQPTIYIDQVGQSRFDFANKAYDFGVIPGDNSFHSGKSGDINPLDGARAASNDFFYCTTGSGQQDPTQGVCRTDYRPSIYSPGKNITMYSTSQPPSSEIAPRRNLWYTFVLDKGGTVKIRVNNKTPGKSYQNIFSVFKSNVDGSLPFSQVVTDGLVDSTSAQGLTFIKNNISYSPYCQGTNEISFYRDACYPAPERYYILVENVNSMYTSGMPNYMLMLPNHQVELQIQLEPASAVLPQFDHYFQAGNIGANLGEGTFTGPTDNFSCATKDLTDPAYYSSCTMKTLWYKFTTNVTGQIQFQGLIGPNNYLWSWTDVHLLKEVTPGDSTMAGLQLMNGSNRNISDGGSFWGYQCISPGTYYLFFTGCSMVNQTITPRIKIVEKKGDFCTAPMVAQLNGPGTSVATVQVDCHTIGTDYGEFNPTLTCPSGAVRANYKTSWFRIDVTGVDTLDVTTFLTEGTNALPADIKYRLMNGNCGAMQERSCVQDAQTQDTYECLAPGSYFIQVFTPLYKNGNPVNGNIQLNLSAVKHVDTCAPYNPCEVNATFIPQYDCTLNDTVTFVNYSTYGSDIQYHWNFGYNGQSSSAVAPLFSYPALSTDQTYQVTLTVSNTSLGCADTIAQTSRALSVFIPARPKLNLGRDTTLCAPNSSLMLNATTWLGATYLWNNGSTSATLNAASPGVNTYHVRVNYNGCVKRDTITVRINSILPDR